jgi:hypothetical protein
MNLSMKHTALTSLLLFSLLFACGGDTHKRSAVGEVRAIVQEGSWEITYFYDGDHEETDDFAGYSFDFRANNTIDASGDDNHAGTWSVNESSDDKELHDLDFNIYFSTPLDLQQLSEDWKIVALTEARIELRHFSGGNGGTGLLTFGRIE